MNRFTPWSGFSFHRHGLECHGIGTYAEIARCRGQNGKGEMVTAPNIYRIPHVKRQEGITVLQIPVHIRASTIMSRVKKDRFVCGSRCSALAKHLVLEIPKYSVETCIVDHRGVTKHRTAIANEILVGVVPLSRLPSHNILEKTPRTTGLHPAQGLSSQSLRSRLGGLSGGRPLFRPLGWRGFRWS